MVPTRSHSRHITGFQHFSDVLPIELILHIKFPIGLLTECTPIQPNAQTIEYLWPLSLIHISNSFSQKNEIYIQQRLLG